VADGGRIISPSPNLFDHPWQVLDTAEVPQGAIFHLPGGLKISGGSSLKIGIHGRFFFEHGRIRITYGFAQKWIQVAISTTESWDLGPLQNCQPGYFVRNLGVGALYFVARGFLESYHGQAGF